MPWRKTRDPYAILISEVMLQQTQVSRVLKKYPEFLTAFPNFNALRRAPLSRILVVWQGMGYNRRVLLLKRLANTIVREHHGRLPKTRAELEKLPGIGRYTAGAILSFVYNQPAVFVDTNIRRVFIHSFFSPKRYSHILENMRISDSNILPLLEKTMHRGKPREWYWALMDYGAYLAKQGENVNRQSVHYAKQSRFEGSRRQARGMILRAIAKVGGASIPALSRRIGRTEQDTSSILVSLEREGFIRRHRKRYSIISRTCSASI